MIITIDGPSGTGKSTIAKRIAKKLGFTFFDTGAMYRSLGWMLIEKGIDPANCEEVIRLLPSFRYEIQIDAQEERHYFVSGKEVTEAIREPHIALIASQIATYPEVRQKMVQIQRQFGQRCNAVFEGRDMGTVVFPDADLKIFLMATPAVRARRRYEELLQKFPDFSFKLERIQYEIEERDRNDSTRTISPLKQAPNAILIDTSSLTVEEVVTRILSLLPLKKRYPKMKGSYAFVYWMARIFFKICFRLKIYGLDHFRPGTGIIASNHTSNYDPPVLSISCPQEVHFLAKESLFKVPVLGWLIRILNSHPVSRTASDSHTFKQLFRLLQDGKKVILFPEGKRSSDGMLKPLERGLFFIAQRTHCPIFPAYIRGTFDAWPVGKKKQSGNFLLRQRRC